MLAPYFLKFLVRGAANSSEIHHKWRPGVCFYLQNRVK